MVRRQGCRIERAEGVMVDGEWARGPFGLDARRGQTLRCLRTALVVVHTVTAGTRLRRVVPLLETDRRVQVVFTSAPSALISAGVQEFLARLGGVVVPWRQAVQTRFDLALAASDGLLEWIHAPVVTMLTEPVTTSTRPMGTGTGGGPGGRRPGRSQAGWSATGG